MKVLITRPEGQADQLADLLADLGHITRLCPLLAIEPVPVDAAMRAKVQDLDLYHGVIVVSPNAARYGLNLIDQYWPQFPVRQHWLTNGAATARVLQDAGLTVTTPVTGTSAEDILFLPLLSQVEGQRWLIIRGRGGRTLLHDELTARGARVDFLEVYQRRKPARMPGQLAEQLIWADVIMVSSAEALNNLLEEADAAALTGVILVVSSDRIQHIADKVKWRQLIRAKGASNEQMAEALSAIS